MRSGWKTSRASIFSPTPMNLIGLPMTALSDRAAPPGIPVHLRHDHAVDPQEFIEAARHIHRILTRHRIRHEEDLRGMDQRLDSFELIHHRRIDGEPPRGIDDDHLITVPPGLVHSLHANRNRILRTGGIEDSGPDLLTQNLQLLHGGGPVDVRGDQINLFTLGGNQARQLARGRRLSATLKTGQHDRRRDAAAEFQLAAHPAHQFNQSVVNDLDHLLSGGNALQDLLPDGPLPDLLDEIPDDPEIHIGLKQGHADLLQGRLDILLVQTSAPLQFPEDAVQFIGKILKHVWLS